MFPYRFRDVIAGVLPLLMLLAGCNPEEPRAPAPSHPSIPFENEGTLTFLRGDEALVTIDIEIADTDSARTRGLMQRESLPDRSGMLFIFDRQETQSFWMANTPLALDIMFVNADSQVVTVAKYTRPMSQVSVTSTAPAKYVVETPAGFADRYGIIESDRITWQRTGEE